MKLNHFFLLFVFLNTAFTPILVDKVVAKVDDENIFLSEVEELHEATQNSNKEKKISKEEVLNNILQSKILLVLAKKSGIKVSQSDVDTEVESRLKMMLSTLKSVEALENYFGKKLSDIKTWIRKSVTEQMFVEFYKRKILGQIEVSPKDVKEFFKNKKTMPIVEASYALKDIAIRSTKHLDNIKNIINDMNAHRKNVLANKKKFSEFYSEDECFGKMEIDISKTTSLEDKHIASEAIRLKLGGISLPFIYKNTIYMVKLVEKSFPNIKLEYIALCKDNEKFQNEDIETMRIVKERVNENGEDFDLLIKEIPGAAHVKSIYGGGEYEYSELNVDFASDLISQEKTEGKVYGPYVEEVDGSSVVRLVYLKKYLPIREASLERDYEILVGQYLNYCQQKLLNKVIEKESQNIEIWIDENYKE